MDPQGIQIDGATITAPGGAAPTQATPPPQPAAMIDGAQISAAKAATMPAEAAPAAPLPPKGPGISAQKSLPLAFGGFPRAMADAFREGAIGRALGISSETLAAKQADPSNPVLRFEAATHEPGPVRGAAKFASGLTTPENLLLGVGTGGIGTLEKQLGGQVVGRLISAGFTGDMLYGAYKQVPALRDAWNKEDWPQVGQQLTQIALGVGMAGMAGHHALKGEAPPVNAAPEAEGSAPNAEPAPAAAPIDGAVIRTPEETARWDAVRAKMAARSEDVRGGAPPESPTVIDGAKINPPPPVAANPASVAELAVTPPATPVVAPPAAPAAAPLQQASPNTAEVYTINGRKVNVRYDVREDGDLTNSFEPEYPQEYQPRDTDRVASLQRIAQRKNDMNGALMADSRLASDGAPVTLDDGTVITRNHGTQALRELYDANSPRAQDYKKWITDHAGEFGLDPAKIAGMDRPVLTRTITGEMKPEDVAAFAQEANMSSAARMSDAEVAQALAKRMTGPLMDTFDPAEDGTPNASFVRELIKGLPVEEQGVFMDAKGQISQTGARIVRNTIFAKAYPDQRALERMAESENASLKNITGGMLRAAPKVAQFQESVARGDRFDLGIGPEIADAAAALDGIARSKSTVEDWKAQGDMFGRDPVVSRLVDIFAENRRSGKRIGDVLKEYAEVADGAGSPKQESMFGAGQAPTKSEILEVAYERAKERWNPSGQSDLFGDEASPAAPVGAGDSAPAGPAAGPDERAPEAGRQDSVAGEPPELSRRIEPPPESGGKKLPNSLPELLAGARAERVPRTGAQLADTLRVNPHAAEVLRQAYERASGIQIGDVDGMAARPEHALDMLKGLKGMAADPKLPKPAQQAALRLAAELRKASGSGLRSTAIAVPGAQSHEHVHFAIEPMKFDVDDILANPETRMAVMEARSRGLVSGSYDRAIREVMTRIVNGEHDSLKMDAAAGKRVLAHFLKNSVHDESEIGTLRELAHESLKDTIGKAGEGRSSDSAAAEGTRGATGPPDGYRARKGRDGGDGGVRSHDGGARQDEGPELSRVARDESREAVQKALADQTDKDFGAKLRTFVTGERDVRIAETNQLAGDVRRMIPDPMDQDALTLMRDFKRRPGEMAEFLSGSHKAFQGMNPEERAEALADIHKLEPTIARAQNPTPAMKEADAALTDYYTAHLKEGKDLGFLDSKIDNDAYITHIGLGQAMDVERPGIIQRMLDFGTKGQGPGVGPRRFKFAQKRDIPTVLHAIAYGVRPRTLNALTAMTIYGDQFARTAAAHIMMRELEAGGASKWATFGGQRMGQVPKDWEELAPESPVFRKALSWRENAGEPEETQNHAEQQLFVPPKVAEAMAPVFSRNDMSRVPFFMTARAYQSYIKSVELGMSVFHIKALNLTALNNMGPAGMLAAYQTDMQSPAFEGQERAMVRAGGESPILGRTMEAYHALERKALPTGPEVIRALPVIRHADRVAQAISEATFGVVQRKLKVTDFSLKDAAWLAKHPQATGAEHVEAQRQIAKQVNATYGGLHWENLGVHRITLELSRALLLAPDWTYSNVLNVRQSFEGGPGGDASRLFWLRSAALGVALTAGMSLLLGGKPSKDPSQVNLGKDRNGGDVHQNLFFAGAPGDAITLIHNVGKYGAVYGVARTIFNKFGPIAKTAVDLHDTHAAKADTGVLSKTWTGAKRAGEDLAPVPFAIPAIVRMLRDSRGQYSMQDYVSTALTGQTPTHDAPPKRSPDMRRLMGGKYK